MSSSMSNEQAPAYDDLFESRPTSFLGRLNKYAPVAVNDQPDLDVESHAHLHCEPSSAISLDNGVGGQPHTHCDVCDRRMDRRERRRAQAHCCAMVSKTFILIALFLMIFGIVAVVSVHKKKH